MMKSLVKVEMYHTIDRIAASIKNEMNSRSPSQEKLQISGGALYCPSSVVGKSKVGQLRRSSPPL